MKKGARINRKSVISQLVLSYIVVLLIPAVVTAGAGLCGLREIKSSGKADFLHIFCGWFYGGLALAILLGSLLIFLLVRRGKGLISELLSLFPEPGGGQNEFSYIKKNLEKTLERLKKANEQAEASKEILKNTFLLSLLNGALTNESFACECEKYSIRFNGDSFVVVFIQIEEYSNLFNEQKTSHREKLSSARLIIKNVAQELLGENGDVCLIAHAEENMTAIVNVRGEASAAVARINDAAEKLARFVQREFCVYISSVISPVRTGYDGLLLAYKEALEVYEYARIMGKKNYILNYGDIALDDKSFLIGGTNTGFAEQQFSANLRMGDFERARETLHGIFENNFLNSLQSISAIKCRMFGLINTVLNVMGDMGVDFKNKFFGELDITGRLFACETVVALRKEMSAVIDEIESYTYEKKQVDYRQAKNDIIRYIGENYFRHDLSVSMIADAFGMSPSYLSKFFKKHTGEGLLNYIHSVRLEKGRRLLDDTSRPIKEIAQMVGFYSSEAYIRTFKDAMGITPGRYRDLKRKGDVKNSKNIKKST